MDENDEKLKSAQINIALGVFIIFFGLVIICAIFFTPTAIGKKANLVAGGILAVIGVAMVVRSKSIIKKYET